MICKSLEAYLICSHGRDTWDRVRRHAGLRETRFETMSSYDDAVFARVLGAAATVLEQSETAVMEDVGTFICTHPPLGAVRRLFRFCGTTFRDFLYSLDEIDARARMALPDLTVPSYSLQPMGDDRYEVHSRWCLPGASGVLTGVLRVLASEYGALVLIDEGDSRPEDGGWRETVSLRLFEENFHEPTAFALSGA